MPAYPKSQQLAWNKVDKPKIKHGKKGDSQKQLGAIRDKVRKAVRERSGGICEIRIKCQGAQATEQAHLTTRGTIKHRTTAEDLRDACTACHRWLDSTGDGIKHRNRLRETS